MLALAIVPALAALVAAAADSTLDTLPSYHYGAPIQIECMNRSSYVGQPLGHHPSHPSPELTVAPRLQRNRRAH